MLPHGVLGAVVLCACSYYAKSPFDGTWKTDPDQTKFGAETYTYSLSKGMYECFNCVPEIHVTADGSDQPLDAHSQDTIAVREVDSRNIRITVKRNGKIVWEQIVNASVDGQTLYVTTSFFPLTGNKPRVRESTLERVGPPAANSSVFTGSWKIQKESVPENALFITFRQTDHAMSASWRSGTSWTAKFDGKDYPVIGGKWADTVSLKRLNDHTIEATYKTGGYTMRIDRIAVSNDGKTMTNESENAVTGGTATVLATKQ
jgi:hypothetical protein